MKVIVISDTHNRLTSLRAVIRRERDASLLIHLGDVESQESEVRQMAGIPCEMVRGNNDFFTQLPREKELILEGHRIFLAHGHTFNIAEGMTLIADEARDRGCEAALFGHTHLPLIRETDGVTLVNPGSLSYPRQEGRIPTYILMEAEPGKPLVFTLKNAV